MRNKTEITFSIDVPESQAAVDIILKAWVINTSLPVGYEENMTNFSVCLSSAVSLCFQIWVSSGTFFVSITKLQQYPV